jgi:hypothetical protein
MPYFEKGSILFIHIPKTGGTSVEEYFSKKYRLELSSNIAYYRYNTQAIHSELEHARNAWKIKINNLIENEKRLRVKHKQKAFFSGNAHNNTNDGAKNDANWGKIKQGLVEFKYFKKIRLVRDLQYSLQHMTWLDICTHHQILWTNESLVSKYIVNPHNSTLRIFTIVRNPYDRVISDLFFHKLFLPSQPINPNTVYIQLKKYFESSSTFDNHKTSQFKFLIDTHGQLLPNIHIMRTESLTQDMRNYGFIDFNVHINSTNVNLPKSNTKYASLLNIQSIDLINSYYMCDFEQFGYTRLPGSDSYSPCEQIRKPEEDEEEETITLELVQESEQEEEEETITLELVQESEQEEEEETITLELVQESEQEEEEETLAHNRNKNINNPPVLSSTTFGMINATSNTNEDILRAFASMYTGIPVTKLNQLRPTL